MKWGYNIDNEVIWSRRVRELRKELGLNDTESDITGAGGYYGRGKV